MSPPITCDIFIVRENSYYNFQTTNESSKITEKFGVETETYKEPKKLNLLHASFKTASSLMYLTKKIRNGTVKHAHCKKY